MALLAEMMVRKVDLARMENKIAMDILRYKIKLQSGYKK